VVGGWGTLLGPEGAGDGSRSVRQRLAALTWKVGGVVVGEGLARCRNARLSFWLVGVVGVCGVGSARSLRTVQWTRASLFL